MESQENIIYEFDWILRYEKVDSLSKFSEKHVLRMLFLIVISVIVIFDFKFTHIKVRHNCVLHEGRQTLVLV